MTATITPRATRDIEEIHAYIAAENPAAAKKVALQIFRTIDLVDAKPHIGRPSSDGKRREWSVASLPYVIPYRVTGKDVIILRVFHTSRFRSNDWAR